MKKIIGNIWDFKDGFICIPTNMGFKKNGENVCGRGLAFQCSNKYPEISKIYGEFCKKRVKENIKEQLFVLSDYCLIMFPTKKLLLEAPYLSWKQNSDLETIEKSLIELVNLKEFKENNIYLPLVGTGNGSLDKKEVIQLLEKYLSNQSNVYIVDINV